MEHRDSRDILGTPVPLDLKAPLDNKVKAETRDTLDRTDRSGRLVSADHPGLLELLVRKVLTATRDPTESRERPASRALRDRLGQTVQWVSKDCRDLPA